MKKRGVKGLQPKGGQGVRAQEAVAQPLQVFAEGDEIVGNPMALWIRDFNGLLPLAAMIQQSRLDAAFTLIRAGYEDLIGLRDSTPEGHVHRRAGHADTAVEPMAQRVASSEGGLRRVLRPCSVRR
jgi:hypothetical protein